jgi:hypothetical protein
MLPIIRILIKIIDKCLQKIHKEIKLKSINLKINLIIKIKVIPEKIFKEIK